MTVAAVVSDLILFSRIELAARAAGVEVARFDAPEAIPDGVDLVLVDWSARQAGWAESLRAISAPRVVLFGPHVDLDAHSAARAAGLGPMWARSKLLADLPRLLVPEPLGGSEGD